MFITLTCDSYGKIGPDSTPVNPAIQPPIDSFEEWMIGQLSELANALNANTLGK